MRVATILSFIVLLTVAPLVVVQMGSDADGVTLSGALSSLADNASFFVLLTVGFIAVGSVVAAALWLAKSKF